MSGNIEKWKKIKIGDISETVTKGTTPTTIGFDFQKEGINFIKIESISDTGQFLPEMFKHISIDCNEKLSRSKLIKNDILFSIAGALGRVALVTEDILPANINQALAIIRIPDNVVNYQYLFFALKSKEVLKQFEEQKRGNSQQNLSLDDIKNIKILLPPLEEQERIIKIIETKLIAIEKAKKASVEQKIIIEKLLSSVIQNVIYNKEWEKNSLGNICEFVYGDSLPKQNRVKGNIPVYGSNGQIDLHNKSLTEGKTIIVGRKGSIGEVHYSEIGCWVIDTAYYVKPLIEINIQYLYFLLKTLKLSKLNKASSIPGLNRDDVYKINVNLPTIEEQERIVNIIETKLTAIEKTKNVAEELSSYINALPSSILRKAFNGDY